MTNAPLTFHQPHPGGRIVLMLGQHQIGAVFPPATAFYEHGTKPWRWRFWLVFFAPVECSAETEQAAKNAILAEAMNWLRKAGLQA